MQIRCRKLCVLASMDINVLYKDAQYMRNCRSLRSGHIIFFFWAKIGRPLSSYRHQMTILKRYKNSSNSTCRYLNLRSADE